MATQLGKPALHFWTWHKDQVHQRSFPPEQITAVACTRDGAYCAGGGASGAVHLWETSTGRLLRSWPAHYKRVTCLAFSSSGAELISGGDDTLVSAWLLVEVLDTSAPQSMHSTGPGGATPLHAWSDHTMPIAAVAVGAGTADPIVASVSGDRTLKIRSMGSGAVLRSVAFPAPLTALALDPGEHAVYVGASTGTVYCVSLVGELPSSTGDSAQSGREWAPMEAHTKAVSCLAFTRDAAYVVSGSADGTARVWDLRTRQPVRSIDAPGKVPISGLLVIDRPLHMPVGAGEGYGGKKGPKRMQPLAQFSKYIGAAGPAKPWEGGLVLLDGSGSAQLAVRNEFEDYAASGAGGENGASSARGDASGAVVAGGGDAGDLEEEFAALKAENEQLRAQAEQAMQLAQRWKAMNAELQKVALQGGKLSK